MSKLKQEPISTIEYLWKQEIIPNWDYHWDFQLSKPINFMKYRQQSYELIQTPRFYFFSD